jgi:hypothetical protein
MTTSDIQPPAAQPGWAAPQAEPEKKNNAKKWASVAGTVLVVGAGAAYSFGAFGIGDPEVGDCVKTVGETDFEVVDCGADDAQFKVVGIDEQEMTYSEFEAAPAEDICVDFATTEIMLWSGDMVTEPGTIFCAAAV